MGRKFQNHDNLKNELLQNQKDQQQQQHKKPPIILGLKKIKAKLSDLENLCHRNNLTIDWIIEEEKEP